MQIFMCAPRSGTRPSLQLPTLLGGGGAEERDVVAGGDVVGTQFSVAVDEVRPAPKSTDADGLPVRPAGVDDAPVRRVDERVVHLPCHAQLDAEVVRTYE